MLLPEGAGAGAAALAAGGGGALAAAGGGGADLGALRAGALLDGDDDLPCKW